jgi:hypothetical protein
VAALVRRVLAANLANGLGMRAALVAAAILSVAFTGCSIIKAQPSPTTKTGTLQGVVTGPAGPVANAAVTVTASDASQESGVSDSGGFYSIANVPAGPATFAVVAQGYAVYTGAVVINPDPQTNRQDVSLNPQ